MSKSASTLTLTNAANPNASLNAYVFHPDSVKNATVRLSTNTNPCYTIKSSGGTTDAHTHVDDAHTGCHIATITRRDIFPDTVTFYSNGNRKEQSISLNKWLRKHTLPDGYPVHMMQNQWIWKSDPAHRLGLYRGSQAQCIAYLKPASATQPLTLFLDPTAEPSRNEILVACLILEQRLRLTEHNIAVGGGKFEQNKTVLGHYVHTYRV